MPVPGGARALRVPLHPPRACARPPARPPPRPGTTIRPETRLNPPFPSFARRPETSPPRAPRRCLLPHCGTRAHDRCACPSPAALSQHHPTPPRAAVHGGAALFEPPRGTGSPARTHSTRASVEAGSEATRVGQIFPLRTSFTRPGPRCSCLCPRFISAPPPPSTPLLSTAPIATEIAPPSRGRSTTSRWSCALGA